MLSYQLRLGFRSDFFPAWWSTETLNFSSSPCMPHTPPISTPLIWSPKSYLVSKDHYIRHPISCYFRPPVTSDLLLLPISCYFRSPITSCLLLLPISCYFRSPVTSDLLLLQIPCYFRSPITSCLLLRPVSCYFLSPVTSLSHRPFLALEYPQTLHLSNHNYSSCSNAANQTQRSR